MPTRRLSVLFFGLVLALTSSLLSAWAAEPTKAEIRARQHIVNFPGRTLHGPDHTYQLKDIITDPDGAEHVRFDRLYKGLNVIGGDLVVHSHRTGHFSSASLTLNRWIDLPLKPSVSASRAVQLALAQHAGTSRNGPSLVIYARGDRPILAWDVNVFGEQTDGTPSEKHVMVDANGGQVLDAWDDIHTGSANGLGFFNGPVTLTTHAISGGFELKDPSRGNQYTINMGNKSTGGAIFKDVDNTWGDGTLIDLATVAVDAQYGTAVTWDYYLLVHGRNGISNNGVGAYNRVHYNRKYNNAFWSDSCFCMTYGDGDGLTFNPFDSLDVAGHEMSHGVTSRTANLTYSGESGGLNEATSDIFGTMVEFYANNSADTPDYKIGEKLYKSGSGKALRYMYSPNTDGASADCWYAGVGSLDVHYSSGVANHFYYLLAEGTAAAAPLNTSSPTCVAGNTRKATGNASLTGIGRDKAEKIWFRALTVYMTSATNYAGARTATLNAAAYLYGSNSTEQQAVAAAWAAVLVN